MNNEKPAMVPSFPYEDLSFKLFPEFLEWMLSHRKAINHFLQHGFEDWKNHYKQEVPNPAVAEMGAYLTVFLDMVLAFDNSRGVLSRDESMLYFDAWRGLLHDTLLRCDTPPKMVTQSKTFHV